MTNYTPLLEVLVVDRRHALETSARTWRLSRLARTARRSRRSAPTAEVVALPRRSTSSDAAAA